MEMANESAGVVEVDVFDDRLEACGSSYVSLLKLIFSMRTQSLSRALQHFKADTPP